MGTRGIFGVRVNGQDKLSYNHFDSYPEGLGDDIFKQLKIFRRSVEPGMYKDSLTDAIPYYRERAIIARLVNEDDIPTDEDKLRCRELGFVDTGVGSQSTDDWYCLMRNAQGELIKCLIAGIFINSNDFILDSLFCEWGYILNLDTEELEIYKGFQEIPHLNGRYAQNLNYLEKEKSNWEKTDKKWDFHPYYPCALIATLPLKDFHKWETLSHFLKKTGALIEE